MRAEILKSNVNVEDKYLSKIKELEAEVENLQKEAARNLEWFSKEKAKLNALRDAMKSVIVLVD
ncbi:MAG: hypothetical protein ACRC9P_05510 [Bacteroides sp.]